jgi:hypothetical protein
MDLGVAQSTSPQLAGGAARRPDLETRTMRPLEQKKLLTIITARQFEGMCVKMLRKRSVGGYTIVAATGAGASGVQSGMLDFDSNILIYVIMSEARLQGVLEDIDELMRRGHRLKALVSDIQILPRKTADAAAG